VSLQYSVALRNAQLAAVLATLGASAHLEFYTGTPPADCSVAASGSLLANIALPATWLGAPAAGSVAMAGAWAGAITGTGTVGYWRLYDSTGTVCGAQGTVTATGGGGDITVGSTAFAAGMTYSQTTFTITAGNA
jgi:hypothetical protein